MTQNGVALVTGAGSGIGRAAARRLARDGWSVACLDLDLARAEEAAAEIEGDGGVALALAADVVDEEGVRSAVDAAARLGPIGCLVNSAGILLVSPVLDVSLADWERVISTNLTGTFVVAREVARRMVAAGSGGRIVNVSSVHAVAPGTGVAAYDASKGGVSMLTRTLALELAPYGINVNAVGPGLIRTGLGGPSNGAYVASTIAAIPAGRIGEPEDVAGAIAFLCGRESSYVTGATLYIDGGMLLTAHT
ncbi:MAG TPA: SDR family NAD(P)-dependent oxidoreductase [Gaiellaceae bacterium]